jgi:hypothetical protein
MKRINVGPGNLYRSMEMSYWCLLEFGPEAQKYTDICTEKCWRSDEIVGDHIFDFYNPDDATYFSLVWAFNNNE